MATKRTKLIIPNAINMVVEVNDLLVDRRKKGMTPDIQLPNLIDRAFLVFHESGVIPLEEISAEE